MTGISCGPMLSMTSTGMPSSGPRAVPPALSLARASACGSGLTVMTACSSGVSRSILAG